MSSLKTVEVLACDLIKMLITVVCGFNLAAGDNKAQGVGGARCVQVPSMSRREDRRRTLAQHDPSHGHAAAGTGMAALSLAARILGQDSSQEGGGRGRLLLGGSR